MYPVRPQGAEVAMPDLKHARVPIECACLLCMCMCRNIYMNTCMMHALMIEVGQCSPVLQWLVQHLLDACR